MTDRVAISGQVPGDEVNGLKSRAKELRASPRQLRLIIGIVDVAKVTRNVDKDFEYPTVRFRHIELVPEEFIHDASAILGKALGDRTGMDQLPFEHGGQVPLTFDADDGWPDEDAEGEPAEGAEA